MTNSQDQAQPYDPWQPRQYDPAAHQGRLQEPPWQQSADPRQGYGEQYPPQGQPWQHPQYDPREHQRHVNGPEEAPWQQAQYPPQGYQPRDPRQPQRPRQDDGQVRPPQRHHRKRSRGPLYAGLAVLVVLAVGGAVYALAGNSGKPSSAATTAAAPPKKVQPLANKSGGGLKPTTAQAAAPVSSASGGCKLKITFHYIERSTEPGLQPQAMEIGNVDFGACRSSLDTFRQEAGQGGGECTTIALASDNPGYDVNASPAPPLHNVIMSAGPGC